MRKFSILSLLVFLFLTNASFLAEPLPLQSPFDDPNFGFHFFCDPNQEETRLFNERDPSGDPTFICNKKIDTFSKKMFFTLNINNRESFNNRTIRISDFICKKEICVLMETPVESTNEISFPLLRIVFQIKNANHIKLISSNLRQIDFPEVEYSCLPYEMAEDFFDEDKEYIFVR
ncbi:hypothetical protein AB3N62_06960 [Leptospira sp. WS4.C2]